MINFHVKNRSSGAVQFTAEINCSEEDATSKKLGLAVNWALNNDAKLAGADLRRANLAGANLRGANLEGAYLRGAYLTGAYFEGANIKGAYFEGAYLAGADLAGASLGGTSLGGANGINDWVKIIQIETYAIAYTAEILQIGCEKHPIEDWRNFDTRRIAKMDGKTALKFWGKYRDWVFQTIALCPAKPTGAKQ